MRKDRNRCKSFWNSLPNVDGIGPLEPVLPEVLQVSDGTGKEIPLATSDCVTDQTKDPYYRYVANTLGKLGSVYSYNRNGVLIKPAQIDGALGKLVATM